MSRYGWAKRPDCDESQEVNRFSGHVTSGKISEAMAATASMYPVAPSPIITPLATGLT
jgi:hypothetical protein